MKIQTFTAVAGSMACNARCPYCVSRMTPAVGMHAEEPEVNWRNFRIGCKFAKDCGVSTFLITGKGEPTLFPGQISGFLYELQRQHNPFPFIELQTNGYNMLSLAMDKYYREWYDYGMTTVALSVVHWEDEKNREVIFPNKEHYDLIERVEFLHSIGFTVRLSAMMMGGYIDSADAVMQLVDFGRECDIEQITVRPLNYTETGDKEVADFVKDHKIPGATMNQLDTALRLAGAVEVLELVHGATVYDVDGQNLCVSNCLTIDVADETLRQLIFFPDGHLRYDWRYPGAILL